MAYQGPQLNDICGQSNTALYAVGNRNTIISNADGTWQPFPTSGIVIPPETNWLGITDDGQNMYIAGTGGIIISCSAGSWDMATLESGFDVKDIATRGWRKSADASKGYGFEEADAWAITENELWQHDGSGWTMVENPEGSIFNSLRYDFTADVLYIAGSEDGKACVFEYNGNLSNIFTDGPDGRFHGLTHYFGAIRFTCGDAGNMFYSAGIKGCSPRATWTPMSTSVTEKLLSLFVPLDMREERVPMTEELLYATGSQGTVLKFSLGEEGDFTQGRWAAMNTSTTQTLRALWSAIEEPSGKPDAAQNRSGLFRHVYAVGGDGESGVIMHRQIELE
jgi:hypothetical protein